VCVLGDKLYCVGGYDGQKHLREVESFDPSEEKWSKVNHSISTTFDYYMQIKEHLQVTVVVRQHHSKHLGLVRSG